MAGGVRLPWEARGSDIAWDKPPYSDTARALKNTPIWLFHGAQDQVVPASESKKLSDALKDLGNEPRFTVYPGVAHNSWDLAYRERGLVTWLLSQRLDQ